MCGICCWSPRCCSHRRTTCGTNIPTIPTRHAAAQDRPGANEEETDGYTRWDLGAEYSLARGDTGADLYVTLNNITDQGIRLSTSFLRDVAPEAGFAVQAGVRLTF